MLSVTNKPLMSSVVLLNIVVLSVVMLNVVAPNTTQYIVAAGFLLDIVFLRLDDTIR
jgi:hypothetical protein